MLRGVSSGDRVGSVVRLLGDNSDTGSEEIILIFIFKVMFGGRGDPVDVFGLGGIGV